MLQMPSWHLSLIQMNQTSLLLSLLPYGESEQMEIQGPGNPCPATQVSSCPPQGEVQLFTLKEVSVGKIDLKQGNKKSWAELLILTFS